MGFQVEKTKERVLETAREMKKMGLVMGTWGNVSASPQPGIMVITPSGMDYEEANFNDMVMVNYHTCEIEGRRAPSVETPLHSAVYRQLPDVKAIIHTHSIYATAFAVSGKELPPITEDIAQLLGSGVPVTEYAPSGSEKLAQVVVNTLSSGKRAVFMANHGLIAVGNNLKTTLLSCLIIEKTAQIYLHATALGTVRTMPEAAVSEAYRFFRESYGQRRCK